MRKNICIILTIIFSYFFVLLNANASDTPKRDDITSNQTYCKYYLNNLTDSNGTKLQFSGHNYIIFDLYGNTSSVRLEGSDFVFSSNFEQKNYTKFTDGFNCSNYLYIGYKTKRDEHTGKYIIYLTSFDNNLESLSPYTGKSNIASNNSCYKAVSCVYKSNIGTLYTYTDTLNNQKDKGHFESHFDSLKPNITTKVDSTSFTCEKIGENFYTYKCPSQVYIYTGLGDVDYFISTNGNLESPTQNAYLNSKATLISFQHNSSSVDEHYNFNDLLTYKSYKSSKILLINSDATGSSMLDGEKGFDFCTKYNILLTFDILHDILAIARILVPLLLVILASIDLFKAVVSGDENSISKSTKIVIKRTIIGLFIFFIPTIVYSVIDLADGNTNNYCTICFTHKDGDCGKLLDMFKNDSSESKGVDVSDTEVTTDLQNVDVSDSDDTSDIPNNDASETEETMERFR